MKEQKKKFDITKEEDMGKFFKLINKTLTKKLKGINGVDLISDIINKTQSLSSYSANVYLAQNLLNRLFDVYAQCVEDTLNEVEKESDIKIVSCHTNNVSQSDQLEFLGIGRNYRSVRYYNYNTPLEKIRKLHDKTLSAIIKNKKELKNWFLKLVQDDTIVFVRADNKFNSYDVMDIINVKDKNNKMPNVSTSAFSCNDGRKIMLYNIQKKFLELMMDKLQISLKSNEKRLIENMLNEIFGRKYNLNPEYMPSEQLNLVIDHNTQIGGYYSTSTKESIRSKISISAKTSRNYLNRIYITLEYDSFGNLVNPLIWDYADINTKQLFSITISMDTINTHKEQHEEEIKEQNNEHIDKLMAIYNFIRQTKNLQRFTNDISEIITNTFKEFKEEYAKLIKHYKSFFTNPDTNLENILVVAEYFNENMKLKQGVYIIK